MENQLFWFNESDIIVKLVGNTFTTHRKISPREEEIINQYIIKVVFKNEENPTVHNGGVNPTLEKRQNEIKSKLEQQKAQGQFADYIEDEVKNLIDSSMKNYYFEMIGDFIIRYKELEEGPEKAEVMLGLYELVSNYNKIVPANKTIVDMTTLIGETDEGKDSSTRTKSK